MRWLFKSAHIVDPGGPHHNKVRDVLVVDGMITQVKATITASKARTIKQANLHLSPGWIDLKAHFQDPGAEYKEDLSSGLDAAAKGGFTGVVVMPSTDPPIDSKSGIEYMLKRSASHPVKLLPVGTLSAKREGKQLAELYDMHSNGAVAFSDDAPVDRTDLMNRALEYSKTFGGVVYSHPHEADLCPAGVMHEGIMSTQLGLKGIPDVAEIIRLSRDIDLLRYTRGRMHVALISSAKSVELIRRAKKEGLQITCGVSAYHLIFTDDDLHSFDSNFKVMPPLRSKADQQALIKGVKDGTIDVICSDHKPENIEHKRVEFDLAAFGISGIETCFSAARTSLSNKEDLTRLIESLSHGPRRVLEMDIVHIEAGTSADLTAFDPDLKAILENDQIQSKSKNNPLINRELTGQVIAVIRAEHCIRFDEA
jgi:dihydroorotase